MCSAVKKFSSSPIGRWCDTGGDFCQYFPQKCFLDKVERVCETAFTPCKTEIVSWKQHKWTCLKEHLDHVRVKLSSMSNSSEIFQNRFHWKFPFSSLLFSSLLFSSLLFSSLLFSSLLFPLSPGPSLYKVNSRNPSGSSPILSGPGHHYIVASLCSEQKRRLRCAHIKGGLSNLGLAMCWWSESLEQPRRSYLSPTDSFCFLLQHNRLPVTLTHACMALHGQMCTLTNTSAHSLVWKHTHKLTQSHNNTHNIDISRICSAEWVSLSLLQPLLRAEPGSVNIWNGLNDYPWTDARKKNPLHSKFDIKYFNHSS